MSSDGSVSSRISQFGLYRTIDARTEEFLKLSKKRQIKQGCVCAAISTALTVTVVVTVLLIYEYNVIAEARRSSHKANWLSLMNSSADDPNLLEILNKEKIDIDKTTLKLLPILLKALNQNRYMEKVVEEPASPYVPYGKEMTTEAAITKNIFGDTRNWMKTPHSRLYTIEYKTSPIVYFKNPTRNIEYFTKIRKIRDYQRIMNYVDKMISDKNSLGTTQPMKKDYGYTEKPNKQTTPTRKLKSTVKVVNKQKMPSKTETEENKINCKCSHKLSEIMYKLINSIQQLLSYFSGSKAKEMFRCNNDKPTDAKVSNTLNKKPVSKNVYKMITENYNALLKLEPKVTKSPSYKMFLNRHKYTIDAPAKSFDIRKDHTVNAIMNLIKPNFNKHNEVEINFETNESFSTTDSYLKPLNMNSILKESNNKVSSKPLDKTKTSTDTATTLADYILHKGAYDMSLETKLPLSTFPDTDFNDDDDYVETTEATTIYTHNLNEHIRNLKFSKSKPMAEIPNVSDGEKSYKFKGARRSQSSVNSFGTMRKLGNLVSNEKPVTLFLPNPHRMAPISKQILKPIAPLISKTINKINDTYTKTPTEKTTTIQVITTSWNKDTERKDTNLKQNKIKNTTIERKTENVSDENMSKETALKHIEEAMMALNNETETNQIEIYKQNSTDSGHWKMVRLNENETSSKSMIPLGRSTYLEMQRNDWKHDENHDFDNDLNYIFD